MSLIKKRDALLMNEVVEGPKWVTVWEGSTARITSDITINGQGANINEWRYATASRTVTEFTTNTSVKRRYTLGHYSRNSNAGSWSSTINVPLGTLQSSTKIVEYEADEIGSKVLDSYSTQITTYATGRVDLISGAAAQYASRIPIRRYDYYITKYEEFK